jgi:predicted transcriptional regulator
MKTAISLPDSIFEAADTLAEKLHVSRSKLYVMALEKFIRDNQETETTKIIDDFIDQHGQPVESDFKAKTISDMRKVIW